ncbi:family 78 glycoside hydrolase catalytic domain [Microbacterium sp. AGC85]
MSQQPELRGHSHHDARVRQALNSAEWIGPGEQAAPSAGRRPAYLLRTEFLLDSVTPSLLTATAEGVYEVFLNGVRTDDAELKPGFSSYRSRLAVQQADVTTLLKPGRNVLGVILSDGWFRGRHGFERRADGFGADTSVLLALCDQTGVIVSSGSGWLWRESAIYRADLMDGQGEDRRRHDPLWATTDGDTAAYAPVAVRPVSEDGSARLFADDRPPIRRIEVLQPQNVRWLGEESVVIDFGQNINGWVRLGALGPRGTRLTLTHGEHLADTGRLDTEHLRAFRFSDHTLLEAGQVDEVISAGTADDVFEPRHTTHGFRYVQIDGYPRSQDVEIEAVVVHSDLTVSGGFIAADPELVRLHEAVRWSFRGNACGLPTDCPQRERSGFTGDWQLFVETASRMYDVDDFSRSWLRDLAADQWPDGRVPTIIPNPAGAAPSGIAFEDMSAGSAGWGDAAVTVPWELWRYTGDRSVLAEFFPAAARWVDYAARSAAGNRHPDRVAERAVSADHEVFLWDTGFHFGEWLEPGIAPNPDPSVDHGIVATAYLHRSAHLLSQMAVVLEDLAAHERYAAIAAGALAAWRTEYLLGDGEAALNSQATYARGLVFGLIPEAQRRRAASRLAVLVEDARVGTGFLSTGLLLTALADNGQAHAAMRLLCTHESPSWFAMIDRGATTMWEWWDGIDEAGHARGSLNHYAKGAVASFLHTHVAGLRLPLEPQPDEAGGRLIIVEPIFAGGLESASAYLDLPAGRAAVDWTVDAGVVTIVVTVPARAIVRLPDGAQQLLPAGTHIVRAAAP